MFRNGRTTGRIRTLWFETSGKGKAQTRWYELDSAHEKGRTGFPVRPELRSCAKTRGSALCRAAGQAGHEFLLQDEEENGGRDDGEQRAGEEDAVFLHVQADVLVQHDRQRQFGLQEAFPSWLFPVNQGATTIWERWNSYTLKDGFGNVNMNSFNHYAYGAVHEWVVDTVCGIRLTSPGGKNIRFSCTPDKRIGHAKAEIGTSYGQVSSQWKFTPDGNVIWEISAPANTVIEIVIPDKWQCSAESLPTGCGKYKLELQPT